MFRCVCQGPSSLFYASPSSFAPPPSSPLPPSSYPRHRERGTPSRFPASESGAPVQVIVEEEEEQETREVPQKEEKHSPFSTMKAKKTTSELPQRRAQAFTTTTTSHHGPTRKTRHGAEETNAVRSAWPFSQEWGDGSGLDTPPTPDEPYWERRESLSFGVTAAVATVTATTTVPHSVEEDAPHEWSPVAHPEETTTTTTTTTSFICGRMTTKPVVEEVEDGACPSVGRGGGGGPSLHSSELLEGRKRRWPTTTTTSGDPWGRSRKWRSGGGEVSEVDRDSTIPLSDTTLSSHPTTSSSWWKQELEEAKVIAVVSVEEEGTQEMTLTQDEGGDGSWRRAASWKPDYEDVEIIEDVQAVE